MSPRLHRAAVVAVFALACGVAAAADVTTALAGCLAFPAQGTAPAECTLALGASATVVKTTQEAEAVHHFVVPGVTAGKEILLQFSAHAGKARAFVATNGEEPSADNHVASSAADDTGSSLITVPACDADCRIDVAVTASAGAHVMLQAAQVGTALPVTTGIALQGQADGGQYVYYSWAAPAGSNGKLISIAVTDFNGDPDLFVSTTVTQPTATSNSWSSYNVQSDQLLIGTTDTGRCTGPCTYYIGVYASGSLHAQWSLLVSYGEQTSTLVDGQPQSAYISQHHQLQYQITVTKPWTMLEIALTPSYGDADLYVDVGQQVLSHTAAHAFSSAGQFGEDSVTIYQWSTAVTNAHACDGSTCTIYINVWGFTSTRFTLVAATSSQTSWLQDGVPMLGTVGANQYTYYKMTAFKANTPVTFTLSPQIGDPDLYVSCSAHHPTASSCLPNSNPPCWTSNSISIDQVVISGADACQTSGHAATYYIGVRGYRTNATYTLVGWVAHEGHPVELQDGIRQDGTVPADTMQYYQLTHNGYASDIEFVINTHSGNLEGFVNNVINPTTGQVVPPVVACHGPQCTASNFLWSTNDSPNSDTVLIPQTDLHNCHNCVFLLGIYSRGEPATFSITAATSDTTVTLVPGHSIRREVGINNYQNYRAFFWAPSDKFITFTLTMFSGDADLYASDKELMPTRATHKWSAARGGDDTLTIAGKTITTCKTATYGTTCEIFVSVYGYTNASYALSFTTADNTALVLSQGFPQYGRANHTHYNYYTLYPPSTSQAIHIVLNTYSGDADLYVATDGQQASSSHHQYAAVRFGIGADTISILPGTCSQCYVSIAVKGFAAGFSSYNIYYTLPGTVTQLQNGIPLAGHSSPFQYSYYAFYNNGNKDISISVTPFSGDPDVYIGFPRMGDPYDYPSIADYTWSSVSIGADVINIVHTDAHYRANSMYYIGVHGFSNTTFTITAVASATTLTTLIDGVPQVGTAQKSSYRFFTFPDPFPTDNVTFHVATTMGYAQLYVTNKYAAATAATAEQGSLPTSGASLWNSFWSHVHGSVTVSPGLSAGWTNTGLPYTVGVYCVTECTFTVVATSSRFPEQLQLGVPSTVRSVARGEMAYFSFELPSALEDVTVVATPLGGSPHLVMSTSEVHPSCTPSGTGQTCTGYTWMSAAATPDSITVLAGNPCAQPPAAKTCTPSMFHAGRFFVGVYGAAAGTQFTLTVQTPHITLLDGVPQVVTTTPITVCAERDPQSGQCSGSPSGWQDLDGAVFQFVAVNSPLAQPEVSFSIRRACPWETGCDVSLGVYARVCNQADCEPNDQYPSPDNNKISIAATTDASITLSFTHDQVSACFGTGAPCMFYVGVFQPCTHGCSPMQTFQATFSSSAGTEVVPTSCTEGHLCPVPVGVVATGGSRFYNADLGATPEDITVRLEACVGAATAYMCNDPAACTADFFRPSSAPHNSQYSVTLDTTGHGVFTHADAQGMWHIGVEGDGTAATQNVFELFIGHGSVATLSLPSDSSPTVTIDDTELSIKWSAPGGVGVTPKNIKYVVYVVTKASAVLSGARMSTACGLMAAEALAASGGDQDVPDTDEAQPADDNNDDDNSSKTVIVSGSISDLKLDVEDLAESTQYYVNVVAKCDTECMGGQPGQTLAYVPQLVTTGDGSSKHGLGPGGVVAIILAILVCIGGVGGFVWYRNKNAQAPSHGLGTNQYNAL